MLYIAESYVRGNSLKEITFISEGRTVVKTLQLKLPVDVIRATHQRKFCEILN